MEVHLHRVGSCRSSRLPSDRLMGQGPDSARFSLFAFWSHIKAISRLPKWCMERNVNIYSAGSPIGPSHPQWFWSS